ncbi:hypothetical protein LX64_02854 [Chitinophaga skermanii]|uniref:Uncharacterized protein n=1 Tax=Chitinophaga skermanii TaxID=331697 RepID=A0A327QQB8_9BACT|nr:hypothetical protein [Chitinophaga skermanii]RAJ03977.1 hypothetical protein LX64_02854 [Chitinophaga skermanii]
MKLKLFLLAGVAALLCLHACTKDGVKPKGTITMNVNDSAYKGQFATALRIDTSNVYSTISVSAGSMNGTLVGFTLVIPTKNPVPGTYSSNKDKNTVVTLSYSTIRLGAEYTSTQNGGNAVVNITRIDKDGIEGTFSGKVISDLDPSHTLLLSNGAFSAAFD